ncbi:bifunctional nuclease family protein [Anaeromyxobacter diazotrophicus]|uniref:BFN domain-containing protein n=1 Tax=Anaeromyxobacter diazotrophicus TaxID=2590199 RepID=A0A7I9VLN8_9BACT|nr:bifunctional nuclease domain-containing protein [Anaeromyxobacter diazotrophicus]GEJ57311.1 hypothetical protein AMYX_20520 [Anaeromyxobacter diazotrophicus]
MQAWSGTLLASLLAGATSLGAAPPGGRAELVEVEVAGVLPLEAESGSLLVLRAKPSGTMLPIFVGQTEGAALDRRLRRGPPGRPGSADLLEHAIAALGGRVARVAIEGEQAALFRGRVVLQQGDRRLELEARPSDSIALAVAARAPIFASRQVLAEAGLTREDLARQRRRDPPSAAEAGAGPKLAF